MTVPDPPTPAIQVLVVDDMAAIRALLANFFQKKGLAVTTAADGVQAIQILERNRGKFDLVVTDLHMPGADGFAVLMEAKKSCPGCAVVIVTGYASMESAIQAVRVGAYDYLPKPFTPADLERLLGRISIDRAWRREGELTEAEQEAGLGSPTVETLAERVRRLETQFAAMQSPREVGFPTRG
jgi:DNA-binding NtrC family response regulator